MTVIEFLGSRENGKLRVYMAQWPINNGIAEFPIEILPQEIRNQIKVDDMFLAAVSLDATRVEDLIFSDFEVPNKKLLEDSAKIFSTY